MTASKTVFARFPDAPLQFPGFDGSLEVLLHLLDEGQMEITAVSLVAVAGQYLDFVRLLPPESDRMDFLAEFLVVATQLMLLKSRALLPREAARPVEDDLPDEATLEARLNDYRRVRDAAQRLGRRHAQGAVAFARPPLAPVQSPAAPLPLEDASPDALAAALQRLLARHKSGPPVDTPLPQITIADGLEWVRRALAASARVSFTWLADQCESRAELIVMFLAVLELFRTSAISLEQDGIYGHIWLSRR